MYPPFDSCVFGRQPEGVKTHREHHVEAFHTHETRARVGRRHRIPVTNMQIAGGIRQHGQRVEFGFALIDHSAVQLVRFPFVLPFFFYLVMIVGNVFHSFLVVFSIGIILPRVRIHA